MTNADTQTVDPAPLRPYQKKRWRDFQSARAWVHSQKFTSMEDFKRASKEGGLPPDIPSNPNITYQGFGWAGYPDFLGYAFEFWLFEKARVWAHQKRDEGEVFLASEWARLRLDGRIPRKIPGNPHKFYRDQGWKSWEDFLGRVDNRRSKLERLIGAALGRITRVTDGHVTLIGAGGLRKRVDIYLPDTKTIVEVDGAFHHYTKVDEDIRQTAALAQAGYRVIRIREQAKAYPLPLITPELDLAQPATLRIKDKILGILRHLVAIGVLDPSTDVDSAISSAPKAEASFSPAHWHPFDLALKLVRALGLTSKADWQTFIASDQFQTAEFARIPKAPSSAYRDQWQGFGHWLGTGNVAPADMKFVSYEEAKALVQTMDPKPMSETDWRKSCRANRIPKGIPVGPARHYGNQFSWGDFLGTGRRFRHRNEYLDVEAAAQWLQTYHPWVKTYADWKAAVDADLIPDNIPKNPHLAYGTRGIWQGWGHFLRTGRKKHQVRCAPMEEAHAWVAANLPPMRSKEDWEAFIRNITLPPHIPRTPDQVYRRRREWKGWDYFLTKRP